MLPHYLFYVRVYAREKTYFSHEIALIFHKSLSIPEGEILPQKRVNNGRIMLQKVQLFCARVTKTTRFPNICRFCPKNRVQDTSSSYQRLLYSWCVIESIHMCFLLRNKILPRVYAIMLSNIIVNR